MRETGEALVGRVRAGQGGQGLRQNLSNRGRQEADEMLPESEGSTRSWWERGFHKEGSYTAEPDPREVSPQRLPHVS